MTYPQFPEFHLRQMRADTERMLERRRRIEQAIQASPRVRRRRPRHTD